jgi:hypothetical protein
MSMRFKLGNMEFTLRKDGSQVFFYHRLQQNTGGIARPFLTIPVKRQAFLPMHGRIRIQRSIFSLPISFEKLLASY